MIDAPWSIIDYGSVKGQRSRSHGNGSLLSECLFSLCMSVASPCFIDIL